MARSTEDNELTPIAKQKVFTNAFSTLNSLIKSESLIAAFVLSFSILEDRMRAAMVNGFNAIGEPLGTKSVSDIPFAKLVSRLKRIQVIDTELEKRLLKAVEVRNDLTHQMMWRLDVFSMKHIKEFKSLINAVKTADRAFSRKHKKI